LFSHLKLAEKKGALWHLALALALLVIGNNIGYWLLAIGYWLLAAIAMHWHYLLLTLQTDTIHETRAMAMAELTTHGTESRRLALSAMMPAVSGARCLVFLDTGPIYI
jgi:hypothetical protein